MKNRVISFLIFLLLPCLYMMFGFGFSDSEFVKDLSVSYSLNRINACTKYKTVLNVSTFSEDNTLRSLRNKAQGYMMNYRIYGNSTAFATVICYDEKSKYFDFSFEDKQIDSDITMMSLSAFCSGNTINKILFELELEMMFDFPCDWNVHYGNNFNSPSYVSSTTADIILENSTEYDSYSDLLGKTISMQFDGGIRNYSINNIFYADRYCGPLMNNFLGDFIITTDSFVFENSSPKVLFGFKSDMILSNDCAYYLNKIKPTESKFLLYSNTENNWIQTKETKFFDSLVSESNPYNINFLCLILGLFGVGISFLIFFSKKIIPDKFAVFSCVILCALILLLINIINIFFYSLFEAVCLLNWVTSLSLIALIAFCFIFLRKIKNVKKIQNDV